MQAKILTFQVDIAYSYLKENLKSYKYNDLFGIFGVCAGFYLYLTHKFHQIAYPTFVCVCLIYHLKLSLLYIITIIV